MFLLCFDAVLLLFMMFLGALCLFAWYLLCFGSVFTHVLEHFCRCLEEVLLMFYCALESWGGDLHAD